MRLARLGAEEARAAARVQRAAFDERLPWLAGLHTPDEDLWFWRERMFRDCEVWGAWDEDDLVGIIAFRAGWIDQLYILPGRQGLGIGRALLDVALNGQVSVRLWTFQKNAGARRFYERNGFVVIEETDGSRNEEREPDVLYEWAPPQLSGRT